MFPVRRVSRDRVIRGRPAGEDIRPDYRPATRLEVTPENMDRGREGGREAERMGPLEGWSGDRGREGYMHFML